MFKGITLINSTIIDCKFNSCKREKTIIKDGNPTIHHSQANIHDYICLYGWTIPLLEKQERARCGLCGLKWVGVH